jgi:predicted DNA-binding transcriptional regulator AlpA
VTTEQLLSWKETMVALGVSSPTLYAIVDKRHELQPAATQELGGQRRRSFRAADVAALKRKREGEQTEPEV